MRSTWARRSTSCTSRWTARAPCGRSRSRASPSTPTRSPTPSSPSSSRNRCGMCSGGVAGQGCVRAPCLSCYGGLGGLWHGLGTHAAVVSGLTGVHHRGGGVRRLVRGGAVALQGGKRHDRHAGGRRALVSALFPSFVWAVLTEIIHRCHAGACQEVSIEVGHGARARWLPVKNCSWLHPEGFDTDLNGRACSLSPPRSRGKSG